MDVKKWQEEFVKAVQYKFGSSGRMKPFNRLKSVQDQLDDVKNAMLVEAGLLKSNDHAHQKGQKKHRVAALLADVLLLADETGTELDKELKKVREWFYKEE